jgi:hypothetical protein
MKTSCRKRILLATGLGWSLSMLTGCQTWMAGMTLPSGRYLEHNPQYFPEDPTFPLQRELLYQEETANRAGPADRGPAPEGVNPVPPGGPGAMMPQPR